MKNATQNSPKIRQKFYCEKCDYSCNKKSDLNKHNNSIKHNATQCYKNATQNSHLCNCGKFYKHSSSFYRHKKQCPFISNDPSIEYSKEELKTDELDYKQLLMRAMTQLEKKDEMMNSIIEKIGNTTNNTTNNTINNNQKVKINFFLNEQCKNAINFSDFIERIEVSHDDLENNAQLGFVNGMTKIIMDNLSQLNLHERPIHCTDAKRETVYIKDSDKWEKDETNKKLNTAIQEVSRKSVGSLLEWKQTNPEYDNLDSEFSQKCIYIQQQSIAGTNKDNYYNKIIHNIAKENKLQIN